MAKGIRAGVAMFLAIVLGFFLVSTSVLGIIGRFAGSDSYTAWWSALVVGLLLILAIGVGVDRGRAAAARARGESGPQKS